MTDLRALITQLCDELDHNRQCLLDDRRLTHPLSDKARAALAEPEPEGPTDKDLLQVFDTACLSEGGTVDEIHLRGLRAVLARWGNRQEILDSSALKPISVSERLPGPEDCDAERRCWWAEPQIEDSHDATWNLCTQEDAEEFLTWGTKYGWLPAHALPQPSSPSR